MRIETEISGPIQPSVLDPKVIASEFRDRVEDGLALKPAGQARQDPTVFLRRSYLPRYKLRLFDTTYYLTNLRADDDLGFFVAYVLPGGSQREAFPRIFYKDVSLVWRSATHVIRTDGDNWIGKGALKAFWEEGEEIFYGAEETTDLPLEIQAPLDDLSRRGGKTQRDIHAVPWILHNAPDRRIKPYDDFNAPRRRAMSDPRNLINGNRDVAGFGRKGDPHTLRFVRGYEPDFGDGIIETSRSKSNLYGGIIRKFRILSTNRKIQYQFLAAPKHVWIVPPQALTTEIMSYGVRTVDANCDDDLCVPGFEYHFWDHDEDPPELHTQIPDGYAGKPSKVDPSRADASAWLNELPVIREFKRKVLGRK